MSGIYRRKAADRASATSFRVIDAADRDGRNAITPLFVSTIPLAWARAWRTLACCRFVHARPAASTIHRVARVASGRSTASGNVEDTH
jgi:hypothetical protein